MTVYFNKENYFLVIGGIRMESKRKYIAVILAALLISGLSGCGNVKEATDTATSASHETQASSGSIDYDGNWYETNNGNDSLISSTATGMATCKTATTAAQKEKQATGNSTQTKATHQTSISNSLTAKPAATKSSTTASSSAEKESVKNTAPATTAAATAVQTVAVSATSATTAATKAATTAAAASYTTAPVTAAATTVTTTKAPATEATTAPPSDGITRVTLSNSSITVSGEGAVSSGGNLKITQAGDYLISGSLSDGQIIVNAPKTDLVRIAFNGVSVACSSSSPLYVMSADKVVLTLVDGTTSILNDTAACSSSLPNACIYSQEDITVNGDGTLHVTASGTGMNGISTKNDLKITGGTIQITAGNNALRGVDSVLINGGTVTVKAGNDGVKATNESEEGEGFINIESGTLTVSAGGDALSAVSSVQIKGGRMLLVAAKDGIKTGNSAGTVGYNSILGGILYINAGDDLLNAAEKNIVSGCTIYAKYGGKRTKSSDKNEDSNIDYTCFKAWDGDFSGW